MLSQNWSKKPANRKLETLVLLNASLCHCCVKQHSMKINHTVAIDHEKIGKAQTISYSWSFYFYSLYKSRFQHSHLNT